MEKLTAEQIIEIIKKNGINVDIFAYGGFNSFELGLGESKQIEQEGGEGEGESWHSVRYFKDHDIYLRVDATYTSYEGTDFSDSTIEEVRPVERMVTFYV